MTATDPHPTDPHPTDQSADRARWRRRRRTRAAVLGGLASATALAAGAATVGIGGRAAEQPASRRTGPAATVTVTREDLAEVVALAGQLGYGRTVPIVSAAPGTLTWLPPVGATVRRGGTLLRADEKPVVLLYGFLPMYRALTEDVAGSDVRQLERNLAALGYTGFTVDETFSAATTAAVKRWQRDLGLAETGTVDRERVVYAPGAVRVAEHLVRIGGSATGEVLAGSGDVRSVTVDAEPGKVAWATKGARVTVVLPGGREVAGRVTGVAADAPKAGGGADTPDAAENSGAGAATVEVGVALDDQRSLGALSTAPVDVRYVARRRDDVLTVPVTALLALAEGGYGLEVVDDAGTRVVAVDTGLFADGRVEVSGPDLAEGMTVGAPG